MKIPESVVAPIEFSLRVIASGVMFALIAGVASGLHVYITFLEANNLLSVDFINIFKLVEYGILIYDIVCFAFFLVVEGIIFGKELLQRAGIIKSV
ncbi:hypothetical protein GOL99_17765 [Sinorhizobium medicae]|nr:hypothetical protein [Sinorhizobium medicae]